MIHNHVNDNSIDELMHYGVIGTLGNLGRQYLVSKGLDRLT